MASSDIAGRLVRLSETGRTVAEPAADVRGRTAVDSEGQEIGTVDDLLVDDREERVRFLRVGAGGFLGIGKEHYLVPVEAVEAVEPDRVRIGRDRAALSDVPGYDPELAEDPAYYAGVYGWWGFGPYWAPGYVYPPYPYPYR
ncbi:PRC-barrel domain containing protein [Geodermatophilus sp. DF01-2]|uniref:PRC-barrel domain-containing protein n=1 Tax=Geodermatophilus sp. DF01-2 TaxID=2559610 RepID=UPI001073D6CD|nr:PRC-barrel domain-containing protein [Geodermatophilus sp. DF01_2]TFV57715.1 PRC-barrel domain containing protein [Geodermatophilus sp. DF01_2]